MAKLIVLMGNIGTGKTTYRKKTFNKGEIHVSPDVLENLSRSKRFDETMLRIRHGLKDGKIVVVEGVNINKYQRSHIICHAKDAKCKSVLINFGKGDSDSLARRIKDRPDISAEKWIEIHQNNIAAYEEPTEDEGFDEIITIKQ